MAFGGPPSSKSRSSPTQQTQNPPSEDKPSKLEVRRRLKESAPQEVKAINAELVKPFIYADQSENAKKLNDCSADKKHDIAKIFDLLEAMPADYKAALKSYGKAKEMANDYIKGHKTSKQTRERVKRIKLCEDIVSDIEKRVRSIEEQNMRAFELAERYIFMMVQRGHQVPKEAAREMKVLLGRKTLSDVTKAKLQEAIDTIIEGDRSNGYAAVEKLQADDHLGKAELLNRHGCFKAPDGGTSDVRLLQNKNGSVAYAFKSVAGESGGGLGFLNLRKGASAMREDVSSTINQSIKNATKLDLGFPACSVVNFDGEAGALIEGVKGEMADPEELNAMADYERKHGTAKAKEKTAKIMKNIAEIPDKIGADSLQNVVLSSVLTCQWDCKWGNVIVEDGGKARPIDGGTSIPTKDVVRKYRDDLKSGPKPSFLTSYPGKHPKEGQPMPQAKQKMPAEKVKAILAIKTQDLMAQAKARRDQLVQENPEFDITLMDDSCFDIVQASILGAQAILRNNPDITLEDFAKAYEQWFIDYAKNV
jgi:hypothetical protein